MFTPLVGCAVLGLIVLSGCSATSGSTADGSVAGTGSATATGTPTPDSGDSPSSTSAPSDTAPDEDEHATTPESGPTAPPSTAPTDGADSPAGGAQDTSTTAASSPSGMQSRPSTEPTSCTLDQLTVTVDGGQATVDEGRLTVVFANSSATECTLSGAPEAAVVSAGDGRQQGRTSSASGGGSVVRLQPGDVATSVLTVSSDDRPCTPVSGDGVLVFPPGSSSGAFVAHRVTACADAGRSVLSAEPVAAG
ncbi:hypothetical protein FM119_04815 [Mycetocola reblochoni REB411]|uniref:DUF4232 domain-containing protein n=1 Tax=Mycetocola reblochoni REB411 TaxID=1255698 RepID=A0A1R4J193_9MICO|nr:hypothetical protein FM119_04815 [Mycetocola reblochoni REB411]